MEEIVREKISYGMGESEYLRLIPEEWIKKYSIKSISKQDQFIQITVENFLPKEIEDRLVVIFGEDIIINQNTVNYSHPIESWQELLQSSIQKEASDIHLDPKKKYVLTRIRLDGQLVKCNDIDRNTYDSILRIFKIRAKLNIAEKRIPQEGGFSYSFKNRLYDIRVSTIPTIAGEKLSIRILPAEQSLLSLHDLGMNPTQIQMIKEAIQVRNGSVVVSGPTGSGKSTTLHVLLNLFDKDSNHIITVEDPVEIQDEKINQVQVNEEIGLTYANLLKRLLRQDPDVILLGEIRDAQTARLACEASLTGHFFLTSIHTKSAEDIVLRLLEMGLEPYLISTSLHVLISQRLVRKVCPYCKKIVDTPEIIQNKYGIKTQMTGVGCPECLHTGFKGRIGMFEITLLSDETKLSIVNYNASDSTLSFMSLIRSDNVSSMTEQGLALIRTQVTTWEEIHRCIGLLD